ncbi:MAG: hypothetical protein LBJ64_08885 [Deltaproteobacteria bacterium]|jgi:hypothetical protein|nr:hypothetical protein [Deltaproteobacteria bacterium]
MGPEEMMKQLLRCQTASGKGAGEAGLSSLISPIESKGNEKKDVQFPRPEMEHGVKPKKNQPKVRIIHR